MKKMILIVVDALTPRVLETAISEGKLPTLKALIDAGQFDPSCTTIFPSITHAALTSLATGCSPRQSGIPGSHWFEEDENTVVHYTDDIHAILNRGPGAFFQDMLVQMNRDRIEPETIFEIIERAGLKAACINHLVHRGLIEHKVNIPLLAKLLPGTSKINSVGGPSMLYIGDFVHTSLETDSEPPATAGIRRRYGLDDEFSAETLLYLAKENVLPAFTLTYFMDNDYESHKVGPQNAVEVLIQIDETLAQFCEIYGGLEQTLEEFCIMVTGDHAQTDIADDKNEAAIVMEDLLADYTIAPVGLGWNDEHDLVVCPNMRTVQIYSKERSADAIDKLVNSLLGEPRVDQILWRADLAEPDQVGYKVLTQDRGELHFWPAENDEYGPASAQDAYGQIWHWRGNLAVVDGIVNADGILDFPTYPNAFERIACALDAPNGGQIWATARLGADFQVFDTTVHTGGGSHASLHKLDSHVPLLLAGAPTHISIPPAVRTLDVLPLVLSILEIDSPLKTSVSHVAK